MFQADFFVTYILTDGDPSTRFTLLGCYKVLYIWQRERENSFSLFITLLPNHSYCLTVCAHRHGICSCHTTSAPISNWLLLSGLCCLYKPGWDSNSLLLKSKFSIVVILIIVGLVLSRDWECSGSSTITVIFVKVWSKQKQHSISCRMSYIHCFKH